MFCFVLFFPRTARCKIFLILFEVWFEFNDTHKLTPCRGLLFVVLFLFCFVFFCGVTERKESACGANGVFFLFFFLSSERFAINGNQVTPTT